MSLVMSGKSSITDIKYDFSRGFGALDFKTIDTSLWESLIDWLNSLAKVEYKVIAKYYNKLKRYCKDNLYLDKTLKLYFLFRIRLELGIHPERNIESICFNVFIIASNLSKLKSIDQVMTNLYKCTNCVEPIDIHKVNYWDSRFFTDPNNYIKNIDANNFIFLVHPIPEENYNKKEFIKIEESFKNNDAFLTSVVSSRHRFFYKKVSLILSVPKQNVISTYCCKDESSRLMTPSEVIENTILQNTEVIVCGRIGVSIHPRFPVSSEIKVIGVINVIDKNVKISDAEYEAIEKYSHKIKRKYGVPIIKMNGFLENSNPIN
ncbi:hypothetical protein [Fluviispira multicolorata]|uniref:Uncharacterized protein n=1 Tax=Fluviispira multicolorata TaxID=2654512 RepID=A0A833JBI3_9BACT|nr:hypothetical protein [Fluviispira multicolorata]KAB8029174.1 hypothetical protein GCL57_11600 [Fluviispira multicolorata]